MSSQNNKKLGLITGVFDCLHVGHIKLVEYAASKCDFLVVGILEDPTLEHPTKSKPIQTIQERTIQMNALKGVGAIFVYTTEEQLYDHLKASNYDIRVLGSDWRGKQITGYDILGHLEKCDYLERSLNDYSSTDLKNRIIKAHLEETKTDFLS